MGGGSSAPPPPLDPTPVTPPEVDNEELARQRRAIDSQRRSRRSLVIEPATKVEAPTLSGVNVDSY